MNAPLHDIVGRWLSLDNLVESGELEAEDVKDTLDSIEGEFEVKVAGMVQMLRNWKGIVDTIDDEIARLQKRKKARENAIEHVRGYICNAMAGLNLKRVKNPLFGITRVKGRDGVAIVDENLLPDDVVEARVVLDVNTKEVLRRLLANEAVPGAALKQGAEYIQIR